MIFLFFINSLFGQNIKKDTNKRSFFAKPIISMEIYGAYPDYLIKNSKNNYSYGGAISFQLKRTKYSIGFNYSTKYYTENFDSYYNYFDKIDFKTTYYNIPVSISFPLFNKDFKKKNDLIIGAGMILNIPEKYEANISYMQEQLSPNPYIIPKSELGIGKSLQVLFRYKRRLNKTFDFYLGGFINYKFSLEYEYTSSPMTTWRPSFAEDRLSFGINTGFELYFKR